MLKQKGEVPILLNWDHQTARKILDDTRKVVVLDWDRTLIHAVPLPPLGQKAPSENGENFLGRVRYGLNGERMEHALFLRPHAVELIEACKTSGYHLVLWSQGVPEYMVDCLKLFKLYDKFDLVIPRHPSNSVQPKDLWIIRPNLTTIVIVDDSLTSSVLNPFNAIEIGSWVYTTAGDFELSYIPSLVRHRFLALENMSPDYLSQLRELSLREMARKAIKTIFRFTSNEMKLKWKIVDKKERTSEDPSNLDTSNDLQNKLEKKVWDLPDITLLTLITYDLNTMVEIIAAQFNHRNAYLQQTFQMADSRTREDRLREIETELGKVVTILGKLFERLVEKKIEIV